MRVQRSGDEVIRTLGAIRAMGPGYNQSLLNDREVDYTVLTIFVCDSPIPFMALQAQNGSTMKAVGEANAWRSFEMGQSLVS